MNTPSLLSGRTFSVCSSCRRVLLQQQYFSSSAVRAVATLQPTRCPRNRPLHRAMPLPLRLNRTPLAIATQRTRHTTATEPASHTRTGGLNPRERSPAVPTELCVTIEHTNHYHYHHRTSTSATSRQHSAKTPPLAPRTKSRLRTRCKAAIRLTLAAVDQLRTMLDQPDPKLIKVGVCDHRYSRLAYHLEYVDKAGAFDERWSRTGCGY